MSKKEKATREYLESLSKDRVIELCLQFMFDAEISEQQLDQANARLKGAIVPKFERDDYVYALFTQTEIYKGQIDAFDYYTNSYLIYANEDIGDEWIKADKVFKTKSEAEKKLQELRGGE